MTFSMSELEKSHKLQMEEEEDEDAPASKSAKELEEAKKEAKEKQARNDDIALVVCMVCLLILTILTIVVKICFIDPAYDPNVSTFKPLLQHVGSNERYAGNGYLPCNGYVPCQPEHLSPTKLEERLQDAMPCHDYQNKGDGPEGCW
ncbi:uncharacterized protein LOC111716933 [Eurytemora carolleeae]|uniref:uncharacterized protein LOC111716933 n=1 Tax=Eurytemora carolleeae TaxID=1294199 RepID=UPI000C7581F8|nr:uncharacterized protein LOC111716933 [Eurytemora carolleeae]XP_023348221.1 uncharacterized protein LOC111716933 [Eurytemora carolleeae]|eukprot:XP_023348216.1 uncharacterized protein LOC111716933 [Eurytemora affinis]